MERRSVTIRLAESEKREKGVGRGKGSEDAIRKVFRTSRDMKAYHERLVNERKTSSALTSPSSHATPTELIKHLRVTSVDASLHSEEHTTRAADASTETDFEPRPSFGIRIEKRESVPEVLMNQVTLIPEIVKKPPTAHRSVLVTAGSVRQSGMSLTGGKMGTRKESDEKFATGILWAEAATRCMPIIDFNSTVRTTIVHVEEAFSPKGMLRPVHVTGFYSRLPPRTSPRAKRIHLHSSSPRPPTKSKAMRMVDSPLLPEDVYEEVLPKVPPVSTMWKYRGKVAPTGATSIFDIRPIIAWKARLDSVLRS